MAQTHNDEVYLFVTFPRHINPGKFEVSLLLLCSSYVSVRTVLNPHDSRLVRSGLDSFSFSSGQKHGEKSFPFRLSFHCARLSVQVSKIRTCTCFAHLWKNIRHRRRYIVFSNITTLHEAIFNIFTTTRQ
jgi:hypothetical protein